MGNKVLYNLEVHSRTGLHCLGLEMQDSAAARYPKACLPTACARTTPDVPVRRYRGINLQEQPSTTTCLSSFVAWTMAWRIGPVFTTVFRLRGWLVFRSIVCLLGPPVLDVGCHEPSWSITGCLVRTQHSMKAKQWFDTCMGIFGNLVCYRNDSQIHVVASTLHVLEYRSLRDDYLYRKPWVTRKPRIPIGVPMIENQQTSMRSGNLWAKDSGFLHVIISSLVR